MQVYHGSKIGGLKTLKRGISTHDKSWVYATPNKIIATIFISNNGSDFDYYLGGRGTEESPIILVERKQGDFDRIYNLSGSIYTLDGKNFQSNRTGWSAEMVSESDELILSEEHINNINLELENASKRGKLKLYRYPNRPKYVPLDNSDLIPKVISYYQKGHTNILNEFISRFPELKDKLQKQLNY